jgi:choline dehydrogenase
MDFTIHNGKRWSAAEAYLGEEAGPPLDNLRVVTGATSHKLLFAGDRVIGVEAQLDGSVPGGASSCHFVLDFSALF